MDVDIISIETAGKVNKESRESITLNAYMSASELYARMIGESELAPGAD